MKTIILVILAISISVVSVSHGAGQPEKRSAEGDSATNTEKVAVSKQNQQSAEKEAIERLICETQVQQQQNAQESHTKQEVAIEWKLVKYTKWLVIVGGLQALILLLTVAVIHIQVITTRNTERAWVMAQIDGDRKQWRDGKVHIVLGSGTGGDSTGTWIVLSCHNEGKSPGWIYEKKVKFEVFSSVNPKPDFNSLPTVFKGREPIGIGQSAIPNITELPRLEIAEGHAKPGDKMVIYGMVKYRDIFKKKRKVTFGYQIVESADGYILERLSEAPYNNNT
jgi:hypothetical protein